MSRRGHLTFGAIQWFRHERDLSSAISPPQIGSLEEIGRDHHLPAPFQKGLRRWRVSGEGKELKMVKMVVLKGYEEVKSIQ